ncbi:radical SAM protein [Patescibacteria group bacterium]|nr:radical SAM protein [Patescibacteria group bacterium]MBU4600790.1 radical SAM protein [Patescibacteria group bacterium]MCG2698458.1 radical SAM protein [Candidatus Parcubacteria bacterium]
MLDTAKIKKILIVNTKSSDRKLTGMVMWGAWAVASYFKATIKGSDVIFLDENNEDDFEAKFKKIVKDRDTVGFSITSMQIKYTLPLVKYLKENYPHIKRIVGGIHVTLFPDQNYRDWFNEVVAYDLPKDHFNYSLLPKKVKDVYRQKRAQVLTGFNCSYKCAFCVNSVRNCRYEGTPIGKIKADMDYVVKEFNPRKIYFRDEDFFQDINKARAIVDYILEKKYKFIWDTSTRVNHFMLGRVDDEFLQKIVSSGCRQFRFGVESGSQRVLNFLRKGQTVEQTKNAISQCVKHNIFATCSVIVGIPTETAEEKEETYRLIEELLALGKKVEVLGPQMFRPYPGGSLFEEAKKYGFKLPDKFEYWAVYYDKNPIGDVFDTEINYPWLSKKENKTLPFVWVVAHYGLNYSKSSNIVKRFIGYIFLIHWKLRWFGGWDVKLLIFARKKFFKTDLD